MEAAELRVAAKAQRTNEVALEKAVAKYRQAKEVAVCCDMITECD